MMDIIKALDHKKSITPTLKRKVYMAFRDDYINSSCISSFGEWLFNTHNIQYNLL